MTLHLTCAFEVVKLTNERVVTLFDHFFLQFLHVTEIISMCNFGLQLISDFNAKVMSTVDSQHI